jgi:ABC-2 type transport system ATP-binding protein
MEDAAALDRVRPPGIEPSPTVAGSSRVSSPASQPEPEPLLLFEQVSKWYGSVLGLNQVTLELTGGITGLVGANGAGKSTLIRLATGQIRPTLGRVSIRGMDAWHWQARFHVGYCPDHDAFYEDMTGWEFIDTLARLCGFRPALARKRTEEVLTLVGMHHRAERRLRGYSKGMRQRIKIAQALLHDPEFLVLDEPLSGIDPLGRQELLELFRALAGQGKGLLISSHELEELEKLTNHVIVMARGRIAAVGTLTQIRELLDNYPLSVRIELDKPRELARQLLDFPEVIGIDIDRRTGGEYLIVRAYYPAQFFQRLGKLVVEQPYEIQRLEPLDESAHAILGYLLGGSGKT